MGCGWTTSPQGSQEAILLSQRKIFGKTSGPSFHAHENWVSNLCHCQFSLQTLQVRLYLTQRRYDSFSNLADGKGCCSMSEAHSGFSGAETRAVCSLATWHPGRSACARQLCHSEHPHSQDGAEWRRLQDSQQRQNERASLPLALP